MLFDYSTDDPDLYITIVQAFKAISYFIKLMMDFEIIAKMWQVKAIT